MSCRFISEVVIHITVPITPAWHQFSTGPYALCPLWIMFYKVVHIVTHTKQDLQCTFTLPYLLPMGILSRLSILGFFGHTFTSSFRWSLNLFFKMIRNLQRHLVTWHDISLAPASHWFHWKFSTYGCLRAKLSKLHVLEHFSTPFHLHEHSTGYKILDFQKFGNISLWSPYILTCSWKKLIPLLFLCVYSLELSCMHTYNISWSHASLTPLHTSPGAHHPIFLPISGPLFKTKYTSFFLTLSQVVLCIHT